MTIDPTIKSALTWEGIVWRAGPNGSLEFRRITDHANYIILRISKHDFLHTENIKEFTCWIVHRDSKLPTGYTRIAMGPDYSIRGTLDMRVATNGG